MYQETELSERTSNFINFSTNYSFYLSNRNESSRTIEHQNLEMLTSFQLGHDDRVPCGFVRQHYAYAVQPHWPSVFLFVSCEDPEHPELSTLLSIKMINHQNAIRKVI